MQSIKMFMIQVIYMHNFSRVPYEEHLCVIILNLERCHFKICFLFGALLAILFSGAEPLSNIGSGPYEEQFCVIILN